MISKDQKDGIHASALFAGVIAIFVAGMGMFFKTPESIIEAVVYLLLALGVFALQSRICAISLFVYYIAAQIMNVYMEILAEGLYYISIIARISMVMLFVRVFWGGIKSTVEFHRNWKLYQEGKYSGIPIPSSEPKTLSQIAKMKTLDEES